MISNFYLRRVLSRLRFHAALVAGGLCTILPGYSAPRGVPPALLQPTHPEEFHVYAEAGVVWRALLATVEGDRRNRVLVRNDQDLLVSWIETAGGTDAQRERSTTPTAGALNSAGALRAAELAEVGADRVAITTVFLAPKVGATLVRSRRIYYGSRTQPRIANSSGAYEHWLALEVARKISADVTRG